MENVANVYTLPFFPLKHESLMHVYTSTAKNPMEENSLKSSFTGQATP